MPSLGKPCRRFFRGKIPCTDVSFPTYSVAKRNFQISFGGEKIKKGSEYATACFELNVAYLNVSSSPFLFPFSMQKFLLIL